MTLNRPKSRSQDFSIKYLENRDRYDDGSIWDGMKTALGIYTFRRTYFVSL